MAYSKQPTTEVVKFRSFVRLPASAAGNPRYKVTLSDGREFETKRDASVNWGFENSELWRGKVLITLERGRIVYADPI